MTFKYLFTSHDISFKIYIEFHVKCLDFPFIYFFNSIMIMNGPFGTDLKSMEK